MTEQPALFAAPQRPIEPESDEEAEVSAFIKSLEAERTLTPAEKVTARMCKSLAKSIAEGNLKGRSVANDVERLMATMAVLTKSENGPAANPDDLTPAERELFDALASAPGNDPSESSYAS